jgi:malonyl-CoA O-methyltransferase
MSQSYDIAAVAAHFSRAAPTYDAHATLQYEYVTQAMQQLSASVASNARILDAGCGTGAFARIAQKSNSNWRIIGCDISPTMCKISSPFQTTTFVANLQQLPIAKGSLDAALCAFALQWSNDPARVIADLAQTLTPNAPLLIYSFSEGTLGELRNATRVAGVDHVVNQFHPAAFYERWMVQAGLCISGFSEYTHVQYFKSVEDIFAALKHMGATNSLSRRAKSLGNRTSLKKIISAYQQHYTTHQGIPVSWKVVSVMATRI